MSNVYLEAMQQLGEAKETYAKINISDDEFLDNLERYKNSADPLVPCRNEKIRLAMITHSDKNIYEVLRGYFSGKKLNDAGKNLLALSYIVLDGYRYQIAKRDEKEIELNAELFNAAGR